MGKVLCFGEILLRYSMGGNFPQQEDVAAYIGGAESNVALSLAKWNIPVAYCTAMPDHFLSDMIFYCSPISPAHLNAYFATITAIISFIIAAATIVPDTIVASDESKEDRVVVAIPVNTKETPE